MQIASLRSRVMGAAQNSINGENDNKITKKIEVISTNFKSTPTIFSRDLNVEGNISSAGLVEIEGFVKGTIKGNSVIIRENGSVEGDLFAQTLNIRGNFNGNIKAKNISISGKAKVNGFIEYSSLTVEDGACIDGQFKQISGE